FNEVFLTDVFVPDDDVVGPVNQGWTVARATLGNERVSIGGGVGGGLMGLDFAAAVAATPERLPGGVGRVGRFYAVDHTLRLVNLRAAQRAVIGAGPGPEGNVTKLVLSEHSHERAAIAAALSGADAIFTEGPGATAATLMLLTRALSIAGGTSEITRNQIGERILGLPRDPLIK
ncbi:MAG: Acyl-CoA dehydrogenase, partial [Acidimicrobiia bacterium]|nr:Acyl-CoA dehydrogenase [Acidimicrobiia bacterium]